MPAPCLLIAVEKQRPGHVRALHQALVTSLAGMAGIKMVLYVEHTVDPNDLATALWRFCNNLDPKRDSWLVHQGPAACLGLDGTRKTKELDGFQRDANSSVRCARAVLRLE